MKVGLRRTDALFRLECRRKQDCSSVEVNLATLTY